MEAQINEVEGAVETVKSLVKVATIPLFRVLSFWKIQFRRNRSGITSPSVN